MGTKLLKLVVTVFILLGIVKLYAGDPDWERVNYTNSTTFVGFVSLSYDQASEGDWIGAFVGDECRMSAQLFEHGDSLYVSAVLHGGDILPTDGEEQGAEDVTFKLWKSSSNESVDIAGYNREEKSSVKTNPGGSLYLIELAAPNLIAEDIAVNGETVDGFDPAITEYTIQVESEDQIPAKEDITVTTPEDRIVSDIVFDGNVATITITAEGVIDGTETVYTLTFTVDNPCDGVTVEAPVVDNFTACEGNLPKIEAQDGLKYYSDAEGTTALELPYTFEDEGSVYVAAVEGNCESDVVEQSLTITPKPEAPSMDDATVCKGEQLSVATGVSIYTDAELTNLLSNNIPTEEGTLYAAVADGECLSDATEFAVTIVDGATHEFVIDPATVCESADAFAIETTGTITGEGVTDNTFDPAGLSGEYTLTELISTDEGCPSVGEAVITVVVPSTPELAQTEFNLKVGDEIPELEVTNTDDVKWTDAGGEEVSTDNPFTPEIDNEVEDSYTFNVVSIDGECYSELVPVTITYSDCGLNPITISYVEGQPFEGSDYTVCSETEIEATGEAGSSWTWEFDGSVVEESASLTPSEEGTYKVTQTTDGGECSNSLEFTIAFVEETEATFELPATIASDADPITLTATPVGGEFTFDGNVITEFDPNLEADNYEITYSHLCVDDKTVEIEVVNVNNLKKAIADAEDEITNNPKSQTCIDILEEVIDVAKDEIVENPKTQTEINKVSSDVVNATTAYGECGVEGPNTADLEDAIDKAEGLATANEDVVNDAVLEKLTDATETAQSDLEAVTENTSQDDVDASTAAIENAISAFEEIVPAFEALNTAIEEAETAGDENPAEKEAQEILDYIKALEDLTDKVDDLEAKTAVEELTGEIDDLRIAFTTTEIDKTPLSDLISDAEDLIDNDPRTEDKIAELEAAIEDANDVLDAIDENTDIVEGTKAIEEGVEALQAAIDKYKEASTSDLTALKEAIKAGEEKLAEIGDNIGTENGQYKEAEVAALNDALNDADAITEENTQAEVDDATNAITEALKLQPIQTGGPDLTPLTNKIEEAEALLEKVKEGNYTEGTEDDLAEAIKTANEADPQTNDDVADAVEALQAAIDKAKENEITLDKSELEAVIERAKDSLELMTTSPALFEDFLAQYTALSTATDDAEDVLEGATTQKELDDATDDLTEILGEIVRARVGISTLDGVVVYPTLVSETVTVKGVENAELITVVTDNGVIVNTYKVTTDVVIIDLSNESCGKYQIVITTTGGESTTKTVIKE